MQHQAHHHRARLARVLTAATLASCGALAVAAPVGADGSNGSDGAKGPAAHAAKTVSLNEHGQLHLLSKHGFTLNEQGVASGTIKGKITVLLKIVSTSRVTAEVTIAPGGGSIAGRGSASYHKGDTAASFAGSLAISHVSGTYAHARGSGLKFSGTIARSNEAITVYVSGRLSY